MPWKAVTQTIHALPSLSHTRRKDDDVMLIFFVFRLDDHGARPDRPTLTQWQLLHGVPIRTRLSVSI